MLALSIFLPRPGPLCEPDCSSPHVWYFLWRGGCFMFILMSCICSWSSCCLWYGVCFMFVSAYWATSWTRFFISTWCDASRGALIGSCLFWRPAPLWGPGCPSRHVSDAFVVRWPLHNVQYVLNNSGEPDSPYAHGHIVLSCGTLVASRSF